MALIQQVALSFFPEKSVGRVAFSSAVCEDMGGSTGGAGDVELVTEGGFSWVGSKGFSGDEGGKGWGFLWRRGQVAEVRMFSMGSSSSS